MTTTRREREEVLGSYQTAKQIYLRLGDPNRVVCDNKCIAVYLRCGTFTHVSVPSSVADDIVVFTRYHGLYAACSLTGPIVDAALAGVPDQAASMSLPQGLGALEIHKSVEHWAMDKDLGWIRDRNAELRTSATPLPSACFFREDGILLIWSSQAKSLEIWADQILTWIRQRVSGNPLLKLLASLTCSKETTMPPRTTMATTAIKAGIELSSVDVVEAGAPMERVHRWQSYGDAVAAGMSLLCTILLCLGCLTKEVGSFCSHFVEHTHSLRTHRSSQTTYATKTGESCSGCARL